MGVAVAVARHVEIAAAGSQSLAEKSARAAQGEVQLLGRAVQCDVAQLVLVDEQLAGLHVEVVIAGPNQVKENGVLHELAYGAAVALPTQKYVGDAGQVQRYLAGRIVAADPVAGAGVGNFQAVAVAGELDVVLQVFAGPHLGVGLRVLHQAQVEVIVGRNRNEARGHLAPLRNDEAGAFQAIGAVAGAAGRQSGRQSHCQGRPTLPPPPPKPPQAANLRPQTRIAHLHPDFSQR